MTDATAAGDLEPVARRSTAEVVADQLRDAIMHGSLAPGAQMAEADLAQRLGVSRGPLREAMQRLVQEGLLHAEPHRGLFVATLDADDVYDVYAARLAVERAACELILVRDTETAVQRLRTVTERMDHAAKKGDAVAVSEQDQEFHETLVEVSGSPRLHRMLRTLLVETRLCMNALRDSDPAHGAQLTAEHGGLVDAIEAGDAELVRTRLEAHMHDALQRLGIPTT